MSNHKPLKSRLSNGEVTFGSWVTLANTAVAEIMANAGFDWLTVDMEHSAITLDHAQELVRVVTLSGIPCLVRVGENDPTLIKRVMDTGPEGVIVPMVNSVEEAAQAVAAVRYPAAGRRGVGLARAQKYGADFEGYRSWLRDYGTVIVQIEHYRAVEQMEKIMSVDGVDGCMVGPYDISGSVGHPGEFDHPDVRKQMDQIRTLIRRYPKWVAGYHVVEPRIDQVRQRKEEGYRLIAYSLDTLLLGQTARSHLKEIRL